MSAEDTAAREAAAKEIAAQKALDAAEKAAKKAHADTVRQVTNRNAETLRKAKAEHTLKLNEYKRAVAEAERTDQLAKAAHAKESARIIKEAQAANREAAAEAKKAKDTYQAAQREADRTYAEQLRTQRKAQEAADRSYREASAEHAAQLKQIQAEHKAAQKAATEAHMASEKAKVEEAKAARKATEQANRAAAAEHAEKVRAYEAGNADKIKRWQQMTNDYDKESLQRMKAIKPDPVEMLKPEDISDLTMMATEGRGPFYGLPDVAHAEALGPHLSDFLDYVEKHPDMPEDFRPREFDPKNFEQEVSPSKIADDPNKPFIRKYGQYEMKKPHIVTKGIVSHYLSLVPKVGHVLAAGYTALAIKDVLGRHLTNLAFQHEQALQKFGTEVMAPGAKGLGLIIRHSLEGKSGEWSSQAYRYNVTDLAKQYAGATQAVQHLAANPTAVAESVATKLGPLGRAKPELVGHAATTLGNQISYLARAIPKSTAQIGALDDPTTSVPRSEMVKWMSQYEAASNPLASFSNPTYQTMAAVQACYPDSLSEVKQRIMTALADPTVAARVRANPDLARRLSVILGAPMRRSDTPAFIASAQIAAQANGQTPPAPGAPGMRKPTNNDIVKLVGQNAKNFVSAVATPQQANQLENLGG